MPELSHQSNRPAPGSGTDDLIRYYVHHTAELAEWVLEAAIPAAIDALYATRDAGGTMHDAGAAAAVAALEAVLAAEAKRDA